MEPKRKRHHAGGEAGTVVFNVGGRHFEVLRQTIEARPATLLASLLEDIGTDSGKPIFVDASSERFAHILDWYRYSEIHVTEGYPVGGICCDARFFLLPDTVKINGSLYNICPEPADVMHEAASASVTFEAAVSDVKKHWPSFEQYMDGIITEVRKGLATIGEGAARKRVDFSSKADVYGNALAVKRFCLAYSNNWTDEDNVCSRPRLKVLMRELSKRGYECEADLDVNGLFESFELKVGLRSASGSEARRSVQLEGVAVSKGRLPVFSRHG